MCIKTFVASGRRELTPTNYSRRQREYNDSKRGCVSARKKLTRITNRRIDGLVHRRAEGLAKTDGCLLHRVITSEEWQKADSRCKREHSRKSLIIGRLWLISGHSIYTCTGRYKRFSTNTSVDIASWHERFRFFSGFYVQFLLHRAKKLIEKYHLQAPLLRIAKRCTMIIIKTLVTNVLQYFFFEQMSGVFLNAPKD